MAREGIEDCPYLSDSKEIFERPEKVTLKSTPQKAWLSVDVFGRDFGARLMVGLEAELAQANPVSPAVALHVNLDKSLELNGETSTA